MILNRLIVVLLTYVVDGFYGFCDVRVDVDSQKMCHFLYNRHLILLYWHNDTCRLAFLNLFFRKHILGLLRIDTFNKWKNIYFVRCYYNFIFFLKVLWKMGLLVFKKQLIHNAFFFNLTHKWNYCYYWLKKLPGFYPL